jgi:heptosyltransferase-2
MSENSSPAPLLIVPFVWIGDFVRVHSVVKLLKAQAAARAVDMVSSTLCAPLADYMPGVRKAIVADIPRRRLGLRQQRELAGIPRRTGFIGEWRYGLINDMRYGETKLPRMIDQMGALALPPNAALPKEWPLPELKVPAREADAWCTRQGLSDDDPPIITLSPGAVGEGKAWPPGHYAELARALVKDGMSVWVLGGPSEKQIAQQIMAVAGNRVRDLTGNDLRNAVLAMACADVAVTNDSGLMHVSAAIGTPTVAMFGPTSPWHWKPLNPVAAILEPPGDEAAKARAREIGNEAVKHRRTADVSVERVLEAVRGVLA